MRHKLGLATACLHVSAVLYLIVGIWLLVIVADTDVGLPVGVALLVVCLGLIAGIELVVSGLGRRRFWAWVAGLCIFGLYVPSLFFPLGALGLWGLLDTGTRAEFGVDGGSNPEARDRHS
jgi:hypothetical protein